MTAYALSVKMGRVVAGPHVRAACQRHLDDMADAKSRGWHFDLAKVDRVIGFFRDVLRLNGGAFEGIPFRVSPWQAFVLGSVFGWVDGEGVRRFRNVYCEIGKGNGKSPLAAGIGLYCLVSDGEPRAEVYAAGSKKDQAMILFRDAVAMVNQSPELHSKIIQTGGQNVYHLGYPKTSSFFKAISSDENSQSGPRPHCSLIDEVHEHPNSTIIDMLRLGTKGRRQPLQIELTNSGFDRTSICYQHHEYTNRVVVAKPGDVDFNDRWFGYVCALDEGDDPFKSDECWIKANPNLGVSIKHEYLRESVGEAMGMPAKQSIVRRLNFCMWVGAENPWIDGQLWLAAEDDQMDAIEELAECETVVGGMDLSGTTDLSALTLTGLKHELRDDLIDPDAPPIPVEVQIAKVEFWTPKDTIGERTRRDKIPYEVWVEQGHMEATPGRAVDYGWVADRIKEIQIQIPQFRRLAFDPYRIKYLEKELDALGVEIELIPHPQGYYKQQDKAPPDPKKPAAKDEPVKVNLWMPHSVELLEEAVSKGLLRVQKNPCLTWNSASAVLEADRQNNRIFTKRKSRGRIDGIVSLAMATGLLHEKAAPKKKPAFQFFALGT